MDWPDFGLAAAPPPTASAEYQSRIDATREAMARRGFTHLAVYGDREHFANLTWLCGLDPRFEESLLIIGLDEKPLLLTGTERESYLPISSLWNAGGLRHERYEPFSLMGITRANSRSIEAVFRSEGISATSVAGCVGWKSYGNPHAHDTPAYLVDALRGLTRFDAVINAADLFIDPHLGLRTFATAREIAWYEYVNVLASEGMKRMIRNIREGMTDHELAAYLGYNGLPMGCHWGLKTGPNRISLASPHGAVVARGNPLSANVCFWGGNCCRAAWVAESAADLPLEARDYVEAFAGPYFEAMVEWFGMLRIGMPGGEIDRVMRERLPLDHFGVQLNAGHLIHLDECMHTPIYTDSSVPLHSGMVFQSDVIPGSKRYSSTRMEDGYALADMKLRAELRERFPGTHARCVARREFMADSLGIVMSEDVLPLSNLCGIITLESSVVAKTKPP